MRQRKLITNKEMPSYQAALAVLLCAEKEGMLKIKWRGNAEFVKKCGAALRAYRALEKKVN